MNRHDSPNVDITGDGNVVNSSNSSSFVFKPLIQLTQVIDKKIFKRLGIEQRLGFSFLATLVIAGTAFLFFALRPQTSVLQVEYIGRVLNQETNSPISNAKVILDFQDTPHIVYTDSEGIFRFTITTESDKISGRIRTEADNYIEYNRNVTLYVNLTTIEDIRLVPVIPATPTATLIPPFPLVVQLTANKWNSFTPSFSPDGKKIVFISDQDGNHEVYVMNSDGTQAQRLTNTPNITEDVPFYSPDGTKIILGGNNGHDEDIYIMNADGSQFMNITNKPDSNESRARISPSGHFVTFDSDSNGNWEIYFAQLQDNKLADIKQVTNRPDFANRLPSFSPLGDLILFRAEVKGKGPESSRLYLVNLDSTNLSRILDFPNMYYPTISPDGKWVAFGSAKEGNSEIYVAALNGSGLKRLTDHPADDNYPAFSYDGKWIIFASKRMGANFNIFRMQFDPTAY